VHFCCCETSANNREHLTILICSVVLEHKGDAAEDSDEELAQADFERELQGQAVDAVLAGSIGCWEQEQWKGCVQKLLFLLSRGGVRQ
jgi:hypothetical protein